MTPLQDVYDAFLAKQLSDEWQDMLPELAKEDFRSLLESALPYFKFPRVSLQHNDENFFEDQPSLQIQILATYMKVEWLDRSILAWDNIHPQYDEREFSPSTLLDKLNQTLDRETAKAHELESIYYRAPDNKPFNYGKLAGGQS